MAIGSKREYRCLVLDTKVIKTPNPSNPELIEKMEELAKAMVSEEVWRDIREETEFVVTDYGQKPPPGLSNNDRAVSDMTLVRLEAKRLPLHRILCAFAWSSSSPPSASKNYSSSSSSSLTAPKNVLSCFGLLQDSVVRWRTSPSSSSLVAYSACVPLGSFTTRVSLKNKRKRNENEGVEKEKEGSEERSDSMQVESDFDQVEASRRVGEGEEVEGGDFETNDDDSLGYYVPDEGAGETRTFFLSGGGGGGGGSSDAYYGGPLQEKYSSHFLPRESLRYDAERFKLYVIDRGSPPALSLDQSDLLWACQRRARTLSSLGTRDDEEGPEGEELIRLCEEEEEGGGLNEETFLMLLYAVVVRGEEDDLEALIASELKLVERYGRAKGTKNETLKSIAHYVSSNMRDFAEVCKPYGDQQPYVVKRLVKSVFDFWKICYNAFR